MANVSTGSILPSQLNGRKLFVLNSTTLISNAGSVISYLYNNHFTSGTPEERYNNAVEYAVDNYADEWLSLRNLSGTGTLTTSPGMATWNTGSCTPTGSFSYSTFLTFDTSGGDPVWIAQCGTSSATGTLSSYTVRPATASQVIGVTHRLVDEVCSGTRRRKSNGTTFNNTGTIPTWVTPHVELTANCTLTDAISVNFSNANWRVFTEEEYRFSSFFPNGISIDLPKINSCAYGTGSASTAVEYTLQWEAEANTTTALFVGRPADPTLADITYVTSSQSLSGSWDKEYLANLVPEGATVYLTRNGTTYLWTHGVWPMPFPLFNAGDVLVLEAGMLEDALIELPLKLAFREWPTVCDNPPFASGCAAPVAENILHTILDGGQFLDTSILGARRDVYKAALTITTEKFLEFVYAEGYPYNKQGILSRVFKAFGVGDNTLLMVADKYNSFTRNRYAPFFEFQAGAVNTQTNVNFGLVIDRIPSGGFFNTVCATVSGSWGGASISGPLWDAQQGFGDYLMNDGSMCRRGTIMHCGVDGDTFPPPYFASIPDDTNLFNKDDYFLVRAVHDAVVFSPTFGNQRTADNYNWRCIAEELLDKYIIPYLTSPSPYWLPPTMTYLNGSAPVAEYTMSFKMGQPDSRWKWGGNDLSVKQLWVYPEGSSEEDAYTWVKAGEIDGDVVEVYLPTPPEGHTYILRGGNYSYQPACAPFMPEAVLLWTLPSGWGSYLDVQGVQYDAFVLNVGSNTAYKTELTTSLNNPGIGLKLEGTPVRIGVNRARDSNNVYYDGSETWIKIELHDLSKVVYPPKDGYAPVDISPIVIDPTEAGDATLLRGSNITAVINKYAADVKERLLSLVDIETGWGRDRELDMNHYRIEDIGSDVYYHSDLLSKEAMEAIIAEKEAENE